jgi:hypothetical protein
MENKSDLIKKLRSEGKSPKEIKTQLNCSLSMVYYYLSPQERNNHIRRKQKNRNLLKEECRKTLGAKCVICGYDKCQNALHFHHLDPKTKKFTISDAFARKTYPTEEIEAEIKKCILVCANCHVEIHANLIKLDKNGSSI